MDTAFDLTGSVSALRRYKHLYIGGEWVAPVDGGLTESIEAGMVWINTYNATRWSAPYGGFKASGWDREMGIDALAPFLETRTTMINLTGRSPNVYAD